jgi:starvation-inducible DNA-binding protein
MPTAYTVPGLSDAEGRRVAELLQDRLVALLDLQLTLKHIHWNVVGPQFIAVHEMLDPQVDAVRAMTDEIAERIATLGHSPLGTPGAIVAGRDWDDYGIDRAVTQEHLEELDSVYAGVVTDHRDAREGVEDLDPVSEDLLIGHLAKLEMFQWFVRAHLEDASGRLPRASGSGTPRKPTTSKKGAAKKGAAKRSAAKK